MSSVLVERIKLLQSVHKKLQKGHIVLNPDRKHFGFQDLRQMFDVTKSDVKGYPCVTEDVSVCGMQVAIKVIPFSTSHELDRHPANIEIDLLKEFTKLVESFATPHITHYLFDTLVHNKKRAMTQFPLKSIRKIAYPYSRVLVSEYVDGGSIQEWAHEGKIAEKKWKYIVFAVAWTLVVLQDRYKFVHGDLHYGNVLVDTTSDKRGTMRYTLNTSKGLGSSKRVFEVPCCGVVPKLWDLEFSSAYDMETIGRNRFFSWDHASIPNTFDPYFDIHSFMVSILELDIPESLRAYVHKLYPEQLIPDLDSESESASTSDSWSTASAASGEAGSEYESEYTSDDESSIASEYYDTDEESVLSDCPQKHLDGTRLKMGYEKYFTLPTPMDILEGEYLSEFSRVRKRGKPPIAEFRYAMKHALPKK